MQPKWRYAEMMVDSGDRAQIEEGLGLLEELIDSGYNPGECLFALAVGHYRLGNLRLSRLHLERLLRRDPTHEEASAFRQLLREDVFAGALQSQLLRNRLCDKLTSAAFASQMGNRG